jgi:ATP-dependent helicase HepA
LSGRQLKPKIPALFTAQENKLLSTNQFIPGQRWISNTEADLGLGIVVENANRRVIISFPAAGEQRTYAVDNAPLGRVKYPVGELISDAEGQSFTVTALEEIAGCVVYHGVAEDGTDIELEEIDLDSFVHFSKPQDKLFAGQIDKISHYKLRVETLDHQHRQQQSPGYGLLGPRVQLLPHQLYIASQVGQRHAPRVLLADEVGLGKTIEAGLILHQQLLTGQAERALIVVPDSLIHQWLVEMLRRFNLRFTILDAQRCQALEENNTDPDDVFAELEQETNQPELTGNPFESAQLVLCCLSFLTNNPLRQQQALQANWDLLIVDEAHHLQWNETESSPEYACIEALASLARGILLLTATPEQLGLESHFARLRLLDPDRYFDLERFREEEASYQPISALVEQLLADNANQQLLIDNGLSRQVENYLGSDTLLALQADIEQGEGEQAIQKVIDKLLDRHGTGRVLFRNTRDAVEGFPERLLTCYPLNPPPVFTTAQQSADLDDQLHPENLLGPEWVQQDPRVSWLTGFLAQHRAEKILLICAYAQTARKLEEYLRLRQGIRSAVFHEELNLVARDRAAAYFADDHEGAQILVCSEIGSEGRNFQFAHHLVLFDLPLNPDLLEQRIGRLDRIGQKQIVQLHVPYYQDSAQHDLARWYHEGMNAFERVCPIGQVLFERFIERLNYCLANPTQHESLDELVSDTQIQAQQLREELQKGRDRLLELNSCNRKYADEVVEQITSSTDVLELADYMDRIFDHFGVEQEAHSLDSIVLHPGDHMLCHHFPSLPADGLTGTYQRSKALSREDMEFINWEHPIVTGAMEMVLDGDYGNTALCTIKLPPLKPGTLLVEFIFTVHCPAPKSLRIARYLKQPVIRLLVDSNNNDLSNILTFEKLNSLAQKVSKITARELVRHAQAAISSLVNHAEERVSTKKAALIEQAISEMQSRLTNEISRLTALAELNPNIRSAEIEQLLDNRDALLGYLHDAQFKLDALRIIVAT